MLGALSSAIISAFLSDYRHPSGFVLPAKVESYRQLKMETYSAVGPDISIGYRADQLAISATVYLYPVPKKGPDADAKEHFRNLCGQVLRSNSGSQLTLSREMSMKLGGKDRKGFIGVFTVPRRGIVRDSSLLVFRYKDTYLKFRITSPQTDEKVVADAVLRIIRSVKWPDQK